MSDWISIEEACSLPGLRLVLLRKMPSPWGQAARCIFEYKNIPFRKVERAKTDAPDALMSWTRQNSFPAAMYEHERARTGWSEILFLAERLRPKPSLIPHDPMARALMFGLAHEIFGEMGLVWSFRLFALAARLDPNADDPGAAEFASKYHSGPDAIAEGKPRILAILGLLNARLGQGEFLAGNSLTAVDIYWATACNVLAPLPGEQLPLSDAARKVFTCTDADILEAMSPRLLSHRERVYQDYLTLPVEL